MAKEIIETFQMYGDTGSVRIFNKDLKSLEELQKQLIQKFGLVRVTLPQAIHYLIMKADELNQK